MGRKSALPDKIWETIGKRYHRGEGSRALGAEYKISEAAIRKRFGAQSKQIKKVANQLAVAEVEFSSLDIGTQVQVRTLADDLKIMMNDLSSASKSAAGTAKMFAKAAHDATSKVMFQSMADDGETVCPDRLASNETQIAAIIKSTVVANEASKIPLKVMEINAKASKEEKPPEDDGVVKFYLPNNGR